MSSLFSYISENTDPTIVVSIVIAGAVLFCLYLVFAVAVAVIGSLKDL